MKKKITAIVAATVVAALLAFPASANGNTTYPTNDTTNGNHMRTENVRTLGANDNNRGTDWGWLGLLGLLGLAGLRRKNSERS